MFQATLERADILRKVVDAIKDLVKQVNIEATPAGISLQAMDSAHVSLVSLLLKEDGFKSYRCDKEITLGINFEDFFKILKTSNADDEVTLKTNAENNSYLEIIFSAKNNSRFSQYQLNLISMETESLGIPDTEYPTSVKMSSGSFVKYCKDMTSMAETVKIEVLSDKEATFSFNGKSGKGSMTLKSTTSKEDSVTIECAEEISNNYGLQYLSNFAKGSSLSDTVIVNLSTKFPLMVHYDIEEIGYIKFYLAPKMDEDEGN